MSNKLFAQIVALIVTAGLVFLAVVQVLAWQRTRERDEAINKAQAESNAVLNTLYDENSASPADRETWNDLRAHLNSN